MNNDQVFFVFFFYITSMTQSFYFYFRISSISVCVHEAKFIEVSIDGALLVGWLGFMAYQPL